MLEPLYLQTEDGYFLLTEEGCPIQITYEEEIRSYGGGGRRESDEEIYQKVQELYELRTQGDSLSVVSEKSNSKNLLTRAIDPMQLADSIDLASAKMSRAARKPVASDEEAVILALFALMDD